MKSELVAFATLSLLAIMAMPAFGGDGLPDGRIGRAVAPILLMGRADIRAELALSAEQTAGVERAIADLQAKALAIRGRKDPESNRTRAEIDRASRRWLVEHLSDAQQTRLAQLDLQWEGPSALLDRPIVADSIRLSDDQRAKLSRAVADRDAKRKGGDAVASEEIALFQTTLAILTNDQKANWRAMLGPIAPFQTAVHPMRDGTIRR